MYAMTSFIACSLGRVIEKRAHLSTRHVFGVGSTPAFFEVLKLGEKVPIACMVERRTVLVDVPTRVFAVALYAGREVDLPGFRGAPLENGLGAIQRQARDVRGHQVDLFVGVPWRAPSATCAFPPNLQGASRGGHA